MYFEEIADYTTYAGHDADFHFTYNANSGGGQAFLGGRFYDAQNQLTSPETLNGKASVFKFIFHLAGNEELEVLLRDPNGQYEIKPRGNGSTSMKLGVGNKVSPSKVISSFMMLPPTCGVKSPANLEQSILSTNNYWLQSMWLECKQDQNNAEQIQLTPLDLVFCGGVTKESSPERARNFRLNVNKRVEDIIALADADGILPAEIMEKVKLFAAIYQGTHIFQYEECATAIKLIMLQLASEYPQRYSGITDPLPVMMEIALGVTFSQPNDREVENNESPAEHISDGENVLLYGVPGVGKSWTIQTEYCNDDRFIERVVFHPDYTYSDFVGQILPTSEAGNVRYEFQPGPFTKLLKKAKEYPGNAYYLVIEEINRGNAPAIFGDVFQLLDRTAKETEHGPAGTSQYGITNEDIAREVYGDPEAFVRIPSNMWILATMNTADQNVFTLDTAFQRRWHMRMIENSFEGHAYADNRILDTSITWRNFCLAMNHEILQKSAGMTSSEDKRLGAYFVSEESLAYRPENSNSEIEKKRAHRHNRQFAEKVIKYLWDDAFKYSRGDIFEISNYASLEEIVRQFMEKTGDDRLLVFKEEIRSLMINPVQ